MRDFHAVLADKIKNGEHIALYCFGIFASHILCTLEKFYGVLPAVIVDNDVQKKGTAEFGVPVMPFDEARERFPDLQYFICSDDFKYTIIGDMLEKGVQPDTIVNYVPVKKAWSCLPLCNRLLIRLYPAKSGVHGIKVCCEGAFENAGQEAQTVIQIPAGDGSYCDLEERLNSSLSAFERGAVELCKGCASRQEQYIADSAYKKRRKQVAFYQDCTDCLAHCVYCCAGASNKDIQAETKFQIDQLSYYAGFVDRVLSLGWIDDDFTCAIDLSERDSDKKYGFVMDRLKAAGLTPMIYKIGSCLLTYSKNLEELLRQGKAYIIWSLDAGTRETYLKIKQIDAFEHVIENVKRYIAHDAFSGRFIVAKYLIVKGVNDTQEEFDAFIRLVKELGLTFVSLSFDFYTEATEKDKSFIRDCYGKLSAQGFQLTNKNNAKAVTEALSLNSMCRQTL